MHNGQLVAIVLQHRTRPRAAYLVGTAVHVLRQLRQPSKTQRCYSALRLVDARAAMLNDQSLAVTVVSPLEGIPEMRLAMQWSGFAKIRSAKFDQHPHSLTASVQRATKAGSPASLCYTQAYFMRCVYDFTQVDIIYRNIANSFMSKQSIIGLFPASCWPDLTSSPHAINSHAEL